jgi:serine phosphatase RsbU (regulator of sigma subunit)
MTFVANNLLNRAVKELKLTQPHEILNFASQQMNLTFQQGGADSVLKTGMDIAFCTFNITTQEIAFAGAYNPLYIIRNQRHYELKPDSYPIGLPMDKDYQSYSLKKIQAEKGDMLYLFSDGYADQFGGKKNRKFMMKRFRELLIDIHSFHLGKQKQVLQNTFTKWKGNNEQIDDVLLLGIRV